MTPADRTTKKTAVVLGASSKYAVGVAITIMSLEDRSPKLADSYVIYYDGWDEKTVSFVQSLSPKVRLIPYGLKDFTEKHPELLEDTSFRPFISRYSHMLFIYDEYINLLKEFDQVIRMGSDLVIIDDITPLKSIDSIGWRCGLATIRHNDTVINRPNGDLCIFNKGLPIAKMINLFYKYLLLDHWDEIAHAKTAYDLSIPVTELPMEYNIPYTIFLHKNLDTIKIFHSAGPQKIWNTTLYQYLFPEYIPYLERYAKNVHNLEANGPYKNRFQFVKAALFYNSVNIHSLKIENKNITLKSNIFTTEHLFFYKKFTHFYFKLRNTDVNLFRIYFIIENDNILKFTNYLNEHLLLKEKILLFDFFRYNKSTCTYYCTVKKPDIECKLNQMIDIFTLCIDMYDYYHNSEEKNI